MYHTHMYRRYTYIYSYTCIYIYTFSSTYIHTYIRIYRHIIADPQLGCCAVTKSAQLLFVFVLVFCHKLSHTPILKNILSFYISRSRSDSHMHIHRFTDTHEHRRAHETAGERACAEEKHSCSYV